MISHCPVVEFNEMTLTDIDGHPVLISFPVSANALELASNLETTIQLLDASLFFSEKPSKRFSTIPIKNMYQGAVHLGPHEYNPRPHQNGSTRQWKMYGDAGLKSLPLIRKIWPIWKYCINQLTSRFPNAVNDMNIIISDSGLIPVPGGGPFTNVALNIHPSKIHYDSNYCMWGVFYCGQFKSSHLSVPQLGINLLVRPGSYVVGCGDILHRAISQDSSSRFCMTLYAKRKHFKSAGGNFLEVTASVKEALSYLR